MMMKKADFLSLPRLLSIPVLRTSPVVLVVFWFFSFSALFPFNCIGSPPSSSLVDSPNSGGDEGPHLRLEIRSSEPYVDPGSTVSFSGVLNSPEGTEKEVQVNWSLDSESPLVSLSNSGVLSVDSTADGTQVTIHATAIDDSTLTAMKRFPVRGWRGTGIPLPTAVKSAYHRPRSNEIWVVSNINPEIYVVVPGQGSPGYSSISFSASADQPAKLDEILFTPDGSRAFVTGSRPSSGEEWRIYQIEGPSWGVLSPSFIAGYTATAGAPSPLSLAVSPGGQKLFFTNSVGPARYFDLPTQLLTPENLPAPGGDLIPASIVASPFVNPQDLGISILPDRLYVGANSTGAQDRTLAYIPNGFGGGQVDASFPALGVAPIDFYGGNLYLSGDRRVLVEEGVASNPTRFFDAASGAAWGTSISGEGSWTFYPNRCRGVRVVSPRFEIYDCSLASMVRLEALVPTIDGNSALSAGRAAVTPDGVLFLPVNDSSAIGRLLVYQYY